MSLILFPHQLFAVEVLRKTGVRDICLIEDPAFFGDRSGSAHGPRFLKLNRMRILYMRVCMRIYASYLDSKGYAVKHVKVDDLWGVPLHRRYAFLGKATYVGFDVTDKLVEKRLVRAGVTVRWLDSPAFLLTRADLAQYMKGRDGKRLQHSTFFDFVKRKMKVLQGVKSTDAQNRAAYPRHHGPIIPDPYVKLEHDGLRNKFWEHEVKWIKTSVFQDNPGPLEDPGLPMTHRDASRWLEKFIEQRLDMFGKYEDAIVKGQPWMYHSGLSIYLNMGLILPHQVVEAVLGADTKMTNREGFLRQLMGWREYARCYYLYVAPSTYLKNVFRVNGRLGKDWYSEDPQIGVRVVDDAVRDAWKHGYLHHIRRLMVVSNYMMLNEIHPNQAFAWMYEFSLDSWDWVMVFNVYSMGTWSDEGFAMRKPYISSARYLQKMAHMSDRDDIEEWNAKFQRFVKRHFNVLKHTQLAGIAKKYATKI